MILLLLIIPKRLISYLETDIYHSIFHCFIVSVSIKIHEKKERRLQTKTTRKIIFRFNHEFDK